MQAVLALVIGVLYAAGVYLILRRSLVKLIIGLVLLSNGANLLIFAVGGRLSRAGAPIVRLEGGALEEAIVNPLPQALVLTAIVIGFGVLAFALVLFHRAHKAIGTDDLDAMTRTDR
jgi:multicomponent Na+:H+ antiporter subunit C